MQLTACTSASPHSHDKSSTLKMSLAYPCSIVSRSRSDCTSQGEEMLRHCRKVLSEVEALTERARAVKKGQSGILRVGATPQVIETLLSDFILTFRRRYPQVKIHLSEQGGARLPTSLERGDVHLAIMPAGDDRSADRCYIQCTSWQPCHGSSSGQTKASRGF